MCIQEKTNENMKTCKKNALDWKQFFTIYDQDKDGNIFCDIESIINSIDTPEAVSKSVITKNELQRLFGNRRNSTEKAIIKGLRQLVCYHPLEWNKELYTDIETQYEDLFGSSLVGGNGTRLRESSEATDMSEIQELDIIKNSFEKGNLWFAHPVYFIRHLERTGLLEEANIS